MHFLCPLFCYYNVLKIVLKIFVIITYVSVFYNPFSNFLFTEALAREWRIISSSFELLCSTILNLEKMRQNRIARSSKLLEKMILISANAKVGSSGSRVEMRTFTINLVRDVPRRSLTRICSMRSRLIHPYQAES